jgi:hypothetical protein
MSDQKKEKSARHEYLKDYVPLRRGLREHVIKGRMTAEEHDLFVWLLEGADPRDGCLWTTAAILAGERANSAHTIRHRLASLKEKGYIFYESRHNGGPYPVMIMKYLTASKRITTAQSYPQSRNGASSKCEGNSHSPAKAEVKGAPKH